MATGTLQISSGVCPNCKTRTKLERNSRVWGGGDFVMVLFTCGLWALVRIAAGPSWRCHECGSKVKPS